MKVTTDELLTVEPYCIIWQCIIQNGNGEDKATSVKDICAATGLSDRAVRKCVEVMRELGFCVISNVNGYYLPATEDELVRYIKRTEKTARSYFLSLRSAKRMLRMMQQEQQMKLSE